MSQTLKRKVATLEQKGGERRKVLAIKTRSGFYKIPSKGGAWLNEQEFQRWRSSLGPTVNVVVLEMWMPEMEGAS